MMTLVNSYRFWSAPLWLEQGKRGRLPLLLLHGFMGCSEDFDLVVQEMIALKWDGDRTMSLPSIYALDLPGHGKTDLRDRHQLKAYGMAETARGVWEWTQQVQPGPWAIAGYSMGGRLALYLAAHFPQTFPVTVAIGASPGLNKEGDRRQRQWLDNQRALTLEHSQTLELFEEFLHAWYKMPLFSSLASHPNFATMLARRRRNDPQRLALSLRHLGLGQQPFLLPALSTYPGQLQLVVGAQDRKFVALNQAIARRCPRAQLILVPHCGHTVPLENPTALAQILVQAIPQTDEP